MENVVDNIRPVFDVRTIVAPYGDTPIALFLTSVTGFKYRTLNCLECGAEFIERNNDSLFRLNDESQPAEVALSGVVGEARCGNCQQKYHIQISLNVALVQDGIPMYLQPQSVYIVNDISKKLRLVHCMECGRSFHSISDRITQVVDNRIPFEYVNPLKLGPIEMLCHHPRCGQTWALMI